tara:strand:+ start:420 stop:839 length:420 start_codon:yes stop_codon:yes gene_type:complete
MSKVSRGALKQLVKECLFEILLESTDASPTKLVEARKKTRTKARRQPRPALDSIVIGGAAKKAQKKEVDVSNITSDPVMAAIFQDTASTTLIEQAAAERGRPVAGGDAASVAVANSDPVSLFGEAANNWATLAFGGENK